MKNQKPKQRKSVEKKGYKLALLTKDLSDYRTRTMLKYLSTDFICGWMYASNRYDRRKRRIGRTIPDNFYCTKCNGILIESCSSAEFIMKQLRTTAIPYVFLRSHMEGNDVAMDEVHAANLLAKYLLDKQHLIIRYLVSDEELTKII